MIISSCSCLLIHVFSCLSLYLSVYLSIDLPICIHTDIDQIIIIYIHTYLQIQTLDIDVGDIDPRES